MSSTLFRIIIRVAESTLYAGGGVYSGMREPGDEERSCDINNDININDLVFLPLRGGAAGRREQSTPRSAA